MQEKTIETKQCKNCNIKFHITDRDMKFYDKISPIFDNKKYQIPAPTLCPECRLLRRMSFRNERKLYKRKCDATGKNIISIYSPDKQYKVYNSKYWWGDEWDPMNYWVSFDFNKQFFEQFEKLFIKVPLMNTFWQWNENCDFTFDSNFSKNCFMSVVIDDSENIYYSNRIFDNVKDVIDSYYVFSGSSLVYNSLYINNCHNINWCYSCKNSKNLLLCSYCINCEDCIWSKNLFWKKYYIFNEKYNKKDYLNKKSAIIWDLNKIKDNYLSLSKKIPVKNLDNQNTTDCRWSELINCIDCTYCFNIEESNNLKFVTYGFDAQNSYDSEDICYDIDLIYECQTVIKNNYKVLFSSFMLEWNTNCFYSTFLMWCMNCFWCVWLRNKQYCILNKQYTKEEYNKLIPKIIEYMISTWEWW